MKILLGFVAIVGSIALYVLIQKDGLGYFGDIIRRHAEPVCKDCNVLLVTLDTCAAHNIPCYGYERQTTPNFCQFAKNNIFFRNAYANAPWTLPSHASLFTGLLPSEHGINKPYSDRLSPKTPLLSDVLHQHGYETLFFMRLPDMAVPVDRVYGRGMSSIENTTDIDTVLNKFIQSVGEGKKTFANFQDYTCHYPYFIEDEKKIFTNDTIPSIPLRRSEVYFPFTEGFYLYLLETLPASIATNEFFEKTDSITYIYNKLKAASGFDEAKRAYKDALASMGETELLFLEYYTAFYFYNKINVNDPNYIAYLRALYDQTLFNLDKSIIAKIQNAFMTTQLKNNTILIITSDHGEEFGEHGSYGHSTLYDLNIKVPFMMAVPHMKPRSITDNVQSVDIMPTILDLVGIQNNYFFNGMSLVNVMKGKRMPKRILVSERSTLDDFTSSKKIIREGDWKLFVIVDGDIITPFELYNTKKDPTEQKNIIHEHYYIANRLIFKYKTSVMQNNQLKNEKQ